MSAPRLLWTDKTGQPVITTTANGERNARRWGWTPARAVPSAPAPAPSVVPEAAVEAAMVAISGAGGRGAGCRVPDESCSCGLASFRQSARVAVAAALPLLTAARHAVTLAFNGGSPYARLACHAPSEALCHATWTCDCECWESDGVQGGLPYHENGGADGMAVRHYGTFDPAACNLRNWFDDDEEALHGEVTFPVRAEWEGDYYTFHPVTTKEADHA